MRARIPTQDVIGDGVPTDVLLLETDDRGNETTWRKERHPLKTPWSDERISAGRLNPPTAANVVCEMGAYRGAK